jgi:COMPASS component SPP1
MLQKSEFERAELLAEKKLCGSMLDLLDWALKRRQEAVDAKKFDKDMCGYDYRLDHVSVKHQFAHWMKSDHAQQIFAAKKFGPPPIGDERANGGTGEGCDPAVDGMCDRKRCKPHAGWYNLFKKTVSCQIKELEGEYRERMSTEEVVRGAAEERHLRRQRENNWVEVIADEEGDQAMGGAGPA